ncbi:MAG: hypothetical protein Q4A78_09860 [Peptostreptococcaceae bacterium]|nr:hypothetical protein [Peptostreptococcaceae bacterium]
MTAKEIQGELRKIRFADKSIDSKLFQLERLRAQAENVQSVDYSKDVVHGGACRSSIDIIHNIIELQKEINADIDALVDAKRHWRRSLSSLCGLDRAVLEKYYFEAKTWEQTAVELGKDYRWILRVHGRALKRLSEKFSE